MLKISFLELFTRVIPESCIMIYLIINLSQKKISILQYWIVSIFVSIVVYIVRLLPIYFGVHLIINMIICIYLLTIIGIPIVKCIKNTLLSFIILQFCEFINMVLLWICNIEIDEYTNTVLKVVFESPSLVFLIIIIVIIKKYIKPTVKGGEYYEKYNK